MLEIFTLGDYIVKLDGKHISEKSARTQKLWKLLALLIINRDKPTTINTITETIWQAENSDNPIKSLHNLVFRLRKTLSDENKDNPDINYIIFSHNSYVLNTHEELWVDIYEMEDKYNIVKDPYLPDEEKIPFLNDIIDLYKGDFLLDSYEEIWALSAVNRFKRIYIESVIMLSDIYLEMGCYEDVLRICSHAVELEPFEERIYFRLIKGLKNSGQKVKAITVCEDLFELLYREIGVRATDEINDLYRELKSNVIQSQHDINGMLKNLSENTYDTIAMSVAMDVFKAIFRYESRQSLRGRNSVFLVLFSINDLYMDIPPHKVLSEAKKHLIESCKKVIRRNDIISNYSISQVVILLTMTKYEDCGIVYERIKKIFFSSYSGEKIILTFEAKPIETNFETNMK